MFQEALRLAPKKIEYSVMLAHALSYYAFEKDADDEYQRAIDILKEAIHREPNATILYKSLIGVCLLMGDKEALADCDDCEAKLLALDSSLASKSFEICSWAEDYQEKLVRRIGNGGAKYGKKKMRKGGKIDKPKLPASP